MVQALKDSIWFNLPRCATAAPGSVKRRVVLNRFTSYLSQTSLVAFFRVFEELELHAVSLPFDNRTNIELIAILRDQGGNTTVVEAIIEPLLAMHADDIEHQHTDRHSQVTRHLWHEIVDGTDDLFWIIAFNNKQFLRVGRLVAGHSFHVDR